MADKYEITIGASEAMRERMRHAWDMVGRSLQGGPVLVTLSRPKRSNDQNRHFHALIGDIAKQVTFYGTKRYSSEVWKALLVDQFEQDRIAMGEPLTHPGQMITSLDGRRTITVRPSTAKLRKAEAAAFIDFLYAQGIDMGVEFTPPALEAYEQYKEAL